MGAMNNENSPQSVIIPLGSPSADKTVPGLQLLKKSKIVSVSLLNNANVAASDTDYFLLKLLKGSTLVAQLDTRAAGQGAVTALVSKALAIQSGQDVQDALSDLKVTYDETDSGTAVALTDAVLQINYYPL